MERIICTPNGEFSDEWFWAAFKRYMVKVGKKFVEILLLLYYTAKRQETPIWAKTVILGALAYFISPIDAIPDAIPVIGFSDDLGVLVAALGAVAAHITDEVRRQAEETMSAWGMAS
jgi:uncharacterized membrane protein YkvA (DUF1232 family)